MLDPKIRIRLSSREQVISLFHRLSKFPGEKSMGGGEGTFEVTLREYPRKPTDLDRGIAEVRSWLAEEDLGAVTVESHWLVQRAKVTADQQPVLTWKYEDGPADAPEEGSPLDVGPAWLDSTDGDGTSEQIADGNWITRAEARELAKEKGYTFSEDG